MIKEHKVCSKCGIDKARCDYYVKKFRNKNGTYRIYLNSHCKECHNVLQEVWNAKNIDRIRATHRRAHRRKSFGVQSHEYVEMYQKQNFVCAICGSEDIGRRLDIDHDHETGQVRGLLCSNCNIGLGKFKDNPELLRKAIVYLQQGKDLAFAKFVSDTFPNSKFELVM